METSPALYYIHVTHSQATHDEDLPRPSRVLTEKKTFFIPTPLPTPTSPLPTPYPTTPRGFPRRCKSMWRGRWKRVQKLGGNGASRCQEEEGKPRRGLLSLTSKTSPHFPAHTYSAVESRGTTLSNLWLGGGTFEHAFQRAAVSKTPFNKGKHSSPLFETNHLEVYLIGGETGKNQILPQC